MSADTAERQLHDRATRGEVLTAAERAALEAWYARLDREEGSVLARAGASESLGALSAQIANGLGQIAALTERNRELATENAAVRQEIASLKQLLAQKPTPQPA